MFWYFSKRPSDGQNQADSIFCWPTLQIMNVHATVSLNNNSMTSCERVEDYPAANNITGPPMNGDAFNAYVFHFSDSAPSDFLIFLQSVLFDDTNMNSFQKARAVATRGGVSGAIFKAAVQLPDGPQTTFDLPNGFLDLTTKIYVSFVRNFLIRSLT